MVKVTRDGPCWTRSRSSVWKGRWSRAHDQRTDCFKQGIGKRPRDIAVTRSAYPATVKHIDSFSVARVRPRTSKGITELLFLTVTWLDAACPSKKRRDECDPDDRLGPRQPPSYHDDRHGLIQHSQPRPVAYPCRH